MNSFLKLCLIKDLNENLLLPCRMQQQAVLFSEMAKAGLTIATHSTQGADSVNSPPEAARISHHSGHLQPPQSLEEGVPVGQRGAGS